VVAVLSVARAAVTDPNAPRAAIASAEARGRSARRTANATIDEPSSTRGDWIFFVAATNAP
jgi:hypothetical protein